MRAQHDEHGAQIHVVLAQVIDVESNPTGGRRTRSSSLLHLQDSLVPAAQPLDVVRSFLPMGMAALSLMFSISCRRPYNLGLCCPCSLCVSFTNQHGRMTQGVKQAHAEPRASPSTAAGPCASCACSALALRERAAHA